MHVLLTGATGLVGQGVLHECLQAHDLRQVTALVRRPTGRQHPRLREIVLEDFADAPGIAQRLEGMDACFHCAGAPPIGTPEAEYRHVTLALTLAVANAYATANPDGRFLYVSGAHADASSRIMPLRIKGETEDALRMLSLSTVMLRPGGIQPVHGEQTSHAVLKPLYAVGGPFMGLGVRLMPGLMTTTAAVGRAMLALSHMPSPPSTVENAEINRLGAPG
ncbi:NAD-dependent epimerase/dehydratase family protein [Luteimonas aestuarii]|uniref:NAD-dependent epimerase/dehydratase family protein n=1 Tax=Luteimonas aestuarii TaxID=453837 RepID=A0A4R5U3U5_9GAMM|nr:NAD(P)H-binding protein [Luteimonas aestuarii]TDK28392.1 NAD-dependent epimerase/dehydratase family protein [Luteimonas aestuarii]